MKNFARSVLQRLLGFDNYLFLFSIFSIRKMKSHEEGEEYNHFLNIIPNEGIILDIGANIGITVVPMAQSRSKAMVYAFEPMPENIRALKRVVNHFKLTNVKIIETALGDKPGKLTMVMPVIGKAKMQGLSHIISEDEISKHDPSHLKTVPVTTLDDIAELDTEVTIGGIKIDVENFEYYVLSGGRNLLMKHKPIIYCELWENEIRKLTFDYLTELGYDIQIYEKGQLWPYIDQDVINFFFTPKK